MLSENKFVLLHFSKHSYEARTNKEMKNNICFGYSNVINIRKCNTSLKGVVYKSKKIIKNKNQSAKKHNEKFLFD